MRPKFDYPIPNSWDVEPPRCYEEEAYDALVEELEGNPKLQKEFWESHPGMEPGDEGQEEAYTAFFEGKANEIWFGPVCPDEPFEGL